MNREGVYIIAELSANHNGSKELAIETIKAAAKAGADAVKLQTYTADTITLDCKNEYFKIAGNTLWDNRYLYDLYKEAYTPWEWHKELFRVAREEGVECFSTPFDNTAVDFLEELGNPIYKIASFEITDVNLIEYVASKGKPMIISTGIATQEDIKLALDACYKAGNHDITLLKCTSAYPAPPEKVNLATITDMKSRFNVNVGLSDHTMGSAVAIAAVALGAQVIEKHFILNRSFKGPDSEFSMEPQEFREMVNAIRITEKSVGEVHYPTDSENITGRQFARSLFISKDIQKGEIFSLANIRSVRPCGGLHPKYLNDILGKKAATDIPFGTPLKMDMVDNG